MNASEHHKTDLDGNSLKRLNLHKGDVQNVNDSLEFH